MAVEVEPLHLDRPFDYRIPDGLDLRVGQRVQVTFAGRRVRGLVVELAGHTKVAPGKLADVGRPLGDHVWVRPGQEMGLLRWAADRYGAPFGDVLRHALPGRVVEVERRAAEAGWFPPGAAAPPRDEPAPAGQDLAAAWDPYGDAGRALLTAVADGRGSYLLRPLPGEDLAARIAELVQLALAGGRDAVVLVPDRASPTADAVVQAAGDLAVDARGNLGTRAAYRRWLEARCGVARVVVGERSAVWWPVERVGLTVVVEEASPAYKERRSPRHHAREVALERARRAGGVGLLVGTVPSAQAWRLLRQRRLTPVTPDRGAERRARPRVEVVTGEGQARTRLSRQATVALRDALRAGGYGVVLAARRGEGRALVCGHCGERLACPTCASSLALVGPGAACEGCGWQRRRVPACAACGQQRPVPLAAGAGWLGRELQRSLDGTVAVLEGYDAPVPPPPAVLVMTRGSALDAPPGRVDAVVLPDLDGALRRPSLDAAEDTLRLAMLLASWTVHGRRDPDASRVVAQTREPDHPAIRALAGWDPGGFWRSEVAVRTPLRFPPVAHALRLDVVRQAEGAAAVRAAVPDGDDVLGPLPSGHWDRFLIKADDLAATLAGLRPLRESWSRAGVEHRLDVDPVDAL